MSAFKHTPGPWVVDVDATTNYRWIVGNPESWTPRVACIPPYSEYPVDANARLIAAAPDLLAALVLAEDVLSRSPFTAEIWPNGMHPNTGITQIRAAIADATGETPHEGQ